MRDHAGLAPVDATLPGQKERGSTVRKLAMWCLVVAAVSGPAYWWLAIDSRMPEDADYPFDLTEVRQLAVALPGSKPVEVRYEKVTA